ncbi:hypothetical protein MLD38_025139 [Melastoma candidum]|uniref:Uncharacterized protein n=1 Tax=Melastoma candidum TaxID=119954 RepID=A0ACB9NU58_9MYRT|nr:hypothetical protein MLD38_025139 [Melastoma candidum]
MANVSFTFLPPSHVTNSYRSDISVEEVDGAERQRSSVVGATGFPGRIPPGVSILSVLESEEVGKQAGQGSSSTVSLELISNYWNGIKRPKAEKLPEKNESTGRRLSTEEIMRMAGMRFIQSQDQRNDYISAITQRFGSDLSGLSEEEMKEVDLAQLLLAAAEKVGENELDRASRLLSYCEMLSSKERSTAEKVVLLFIDALRERINIARGEHDSKRLVLRNNQYLRTSALQLTYYRILPFIQISQFSEIQVLVENTATASRIHIVDLAVRSGVHVIILMQAILDRKEKPIELLKVSAVATTEMDTAEESGKRLVSVAKSMGLNFSFRVIPAQHIDDVREEMFDIEDGEAVAVYSPLVFKALISRQKSLENLMTVIRSLNPSVMVMTEI